MKDRKTKERELMARVERGELDPDSRQAQQMAAKIASDHGGGNRIAAKLEAKVPVRDKLKKEQREADDPFKPNGHPEDGPQYSHPELEEDEFSPYPDPAAEIRRGPRPR